MGLGSLLVNVSGDRGGDGTDTISSTVKSKWNLAHLQRWNNWCFFLLFHWPFNADLHAAYINDNLKINLSLSRMWRTLSAPFSTNKLPHRLHKYQYDEHFHGSIHMYAIVDVGCRPIHYRNVYSRRVSTWHTIITKKQHTATRENNHEMEKRFGSPLGTPHSPFDIAPRQQQRSVNSVAAAHKHIRNPLRASSHFR